MKAGHIILFSLISILTICGCSALMEPIVGTFVGSIEEFESEVERQDSCEDYLVYSLIFYRESKNKLPINIEQTFYLFEGDSFFVAKNRNQIELIDTMNLEQVDTTRFFFHKCCYTKFDSISISSYHRDSIDLHLGRTVVNDSTERYVLKTQRIVFKADTIEINLIDLEIRDLNSNVIVKMNTKNSS